MRLKRYSWGLRGFPSIELSLLATSPQDRVDLKILGKADQVASINTLLSMCRNLDGRHIQTQASPQDVVAFLNSNPVLRGYPTHRHPIPAPSRELLAGTVS